MAAGVCVNGNLVRLLLRRMRNVMMAAASGAANLLRIDRGAM